MGLKFKKKKFCSIEKFDDGGNVERVKEVQPGR